MLTLTVPDEGEDLSDYFRFTDVRNGAPVGIPDEGVLVSRRFAENYSLKAGDDFLLYDNGMNTHSVRIAGVVENYIGIRAVCSKAYAEESLGVKLAANTLFLKENPKDADALRQELSGTEGFISLASAKKEEALFNGLSFMMNLVILMLGILAVLIACFILLNLVSTYVNEKKNELTIMRINGYTTGETIRYASMECYGITALGILLGLVAGYAFCSFLIRLIEQLSMGFVQEPIWISFAASAVITALISGTIHFFSFRKIRKLKLSDIQK
jgi:putative ABC transport system permease protein